MLTYILKYNKNKNLRWKYECKTSGNKFNNGIELYGGVKNLFDKKYADGVAIMKSPFGPRSVYYPAEGRNIYAGFKYQF